MTGLDAASQQLVDRVRASGRPPLREQTPAEARQFGAQLRQMIGPGPDIRAVRDHRIASRDGSELALRSFAAVEDPHGVIVFFHGGGWVTGCIDDVDCACRTIAARTGCVVVAVDYRLAPEHQYPAALEDAWSATRWADEHRAELGADSGPLVLVGDSAGGNLVAVTSARERDGGQARIALQILVNPVLDADLDRPSYLDPAHQLLLTRDSMIWFWDHYLAEPAERRSPEASPLLAADLTGLPPTVLLLPELDVLRDEAQAYAAALRAARVPVTVRVMPGQLHGFFTMLNLLPGASAGIAVLAEHVDTLTNRSDS